MTGVFGTWLILERYMMKWWVHKLLVSFVACFFPLLLPQHLLQAKSLQCFFSLLW